MLDIEDVISRIPKGVALLDDWDPNWADQIILPIFEMSSYSNCVLGQLFGDYTDGRETLGIPIGEGEWYGFDQCQNSRDWARLDEAWLKVITERQSA